MNNNLGLGVLSYKTYFLRLVKVVHDCLVLFSKFVEILRVQGAHLGVFHILRVEINLPINEYSVVFIDCDANQ